MLLYDGKFITTEGHNARPHIVYLIGYTRQYDSIDLVDQIGYDAIVI